MCELTLDQIHVLGLRREMEEALQDLRDMACDYTEGANGRFRDQCEKCKQVKEKLMFAELLSPSSDEQ